MAPERFPDAVRAALDADGAPAAVLAERRVDDETGTDARQEWDLDKHRVTLASCTSDPIDGLAARLRWLEGRAPTVRLVLDHTDDQGRWLVTTRLAGEPADRLESLGDIQGLVELLGRSLRQLHDLETAGFPFATGWDSMLAEVEGRRDRGVIDPSALPEPYDRYDAARLVELWVQGKPTTPEDLVVCHRSPTLANLFVSGSEFVGFDNVGGLRVADRHLDLAVMHRSLHQTLGGESPLIFFDAYGIDPGLIELDHYVLADMLL